MCVAGQPICYVRKYVRTYLPKTMRLWYVMCKIQNTGERQRDSRGIDTATEREESCELDGNGSMLDCGKR